MGGKIGTATLFVFLVANLLQGAFGVTYTVGDSTGWVVPTGNDDFYDDWADNKIFAVGDVLVFNFTTGQHNVAEVTEVDYDSCNGANALLMVRDGPAMITLNRTGEYHFICAFTGHCAAGQKLSIDVGSGTPSPRPSPTTPGAPIPSGRTYTVGDASGWRVPTGNDDLYDDWNDNKDFFVGDVLLFNFTTGQHDVLEVTEADYDNCNAANPISNVTNGPTRITLDRTGDHYFICGFPGHCAAGQKLNVEVRNGNRNGTAPTPRPSPTTPATPSGMTYTVGDSTGWRVPTGNNDFYDDWNDNKDFYVGDVLLFNFTTGQHDVLEVTEADYDNCNAANPISNVTNGPARITLNRTGDHYFICGFPGHCTAGQKLSIDVENGNRPGTTPTTPGTPSPTTPATPSGMTYTVGDSTGWRVPTGNNDFYDDWNDNKDFYVGDVLLFNFTTGQHDVLEVTEADYDNCNVANPISNVTNGPARITLNRTGDHYFICGFPGHCTAGQKLSIDVENGNRPGTTPTTPGTPSASAPGAPGGSIPGSSSASSLVATLSPFFSVAIALALLW